MGANPSPLTDVTAPSSQASSATSKQEGSGRLESSRIIMGVVKKIKRMAKRVRAGSLPTIASATDDLLSALPDGLLHDIMSFLPARQVVQTTVLSQRWRDLWCSMPYINIDQKEFHPGGSDLCSASYYMDIKKTWDKFVDFTTNFLLFHRNSVLLEKFRIYAHSYRQHHVERWIRLGIKYCPSVLEIDIPGYPYFSYSRSVPAMEIPGYPHFVDFKLPYLGPCLYLHRLKKLSLFRVEVDSRFAELLKSGCPSLIDLELTHCCFYFCEIASTTLEKLVIDQCDDLHEERLPLVIISPSLSSLELTTIIDQGFEYGVSIRNAASLDEASVYLNENEGFDNAENRRNLLGGFYNVTALRLNKFDTLAMIHENPNEFPLFPNMRALSLEACLPMGELNNFDSRLNDLGSFLENAPCLEKLTLHQTLFTESYRTFEKFKKESISHIGQDGKTLRCPKLKLIEVLHDPQVDYLLIELLWYLARRLPDARIKLKLM